MSQGYPPGGNQLKYIRDTALKLMIADCQQRLLEAKHKGLEGAVTVEESILSNLVARLLEE